MFSYLKIRHQNDRTFNWWQTILLIIAMVVLENVVLLGYGMFARIGGWQLGLVVMLMLGYLVARYPLSYAQTKLKLDGLHLLLVLAMTYLYLVVSQVALSIITHTNTQSTNQANINKLVDGVNSPTTWAIIFVAVVMAPICEEFAFRYVLIGPQNRRSTMVRAVLSTVLFGLIHVSSEVSLLAGNSAQVIQFFGNLLQYCGLGLALVYWFVRYRNLRQNIILHALWNALSMMMLLI